MLKKLAFALLFLAALGLVAVGLLSSPREQGPPPEFSPPTWSGPRTLRIAVGPDRPVSLPLRALHRLPDTSGLKLEIREIVEPGLRWQLLAAGEVDLVATSLEDFALGVARFDPGLMIFPVGSSEGSDAVVGSAEDKNGLVAFVPGTPGEFMALTRGQGQRAVAANGVEEAARWLAGGDAGAAALWEPWASALEQGKRLDATSPAAPSVQVWVASRDLLDGEAEPRVGPADLATVAEAWFSLVGQLQSESPLALKAVAEENELSVDELRKHLEGYRFFTLDEAKQWQDDEARLRARLEEILRVWSLAGAPNTPRTDYSTAIDFEVLKSLQSPSGLGAAATPEPTSTPEASPTPESTPVTAVSPTSSTGQMLAANPARTGVFDTEPLREQTEVVWTSNLPGDVRTCPIPAGNLLLVGCDDGKLYALDMQKKGRRVWQAAAGDAVASTPAVAGGTAFFGSNDGRLYAVKAEDGSRLWTFPTDKAISSSPAVVEGVVFFGSQDGSLYAVDAASGKPRWSYATGGAVHGSPALDSGLVFTGSQDGKLHAVSAGDGKAAWTYEAGSALVASPVADRGMVYGVSLRGRVFCLAASDGKEIWQTQLEGEVLASPVLDQNVLVIGTKDGEIYGLDAASGEQKWNHPTRAAVTSVPSAAGGVVYVGGEDSRIYALDVATGERLWRFRISDGWIYSPLVLDRTVYFGSSDDKVYAIR